MKKSLSLWITSTRPTGLIENNVKILKNKTTLGWFFSYKAPHFWLASCDKPKLPVEYLDNLKGDLNESY